MQSPLALLSLVLAAGAAGLAGYALSRAPTETAQLEARLASVEDQLSRVERSLDALAAREVLVEAPSLLGLSADTPTKLSNASSGVTEGAPTRGEPNVTERAPTGSLASPEGEAALTEMVSAAVEKKAAQLLAMREKKPSIDTFARTLELDDAQRAAIERGVLSSQHEIKSILEIETEAGANFLDDLVEVFADGIAHPGKNPKAGQALFTRLLTEKIPGSNETYAERVEGVKSRLRAALKRDLNPKQHTAFQTWQMDPTEIKGIAGSPWKAIEKRVGERVKELVPDTPR